MKQEDKAHVINIPNPPMPHCNASEVEIKEALNNINATLEEIKAVQQSLGVFNSNVTSRLLRSLNTLTDTQKSAVRQAMYSNNTFATYSTHILKKLDAFERESNAQATWRLNILTERLKALESATHNAAYWLAAIALCSAITAVSSVIIAIHS